MTGWRTTDALQCDLGRLPRGAPTHHQAEPVRPRAHQPPLRAPGCHKLYWRSPTGTTICWGIRRAPDVLARGCASTQANHVAPRPGSSAYPFTPTRGAAARSSLGVLEEIGRGRRDAEAGNARAEKCWLAIGGIARGDRWRDAAGPRGRARTQARGGAGWALEFLTAWCAPSGSTAARRLPA